MGGRKRMPFNVREKEYTIWCKGERRYHFMWGRKKIPFYAREKDDTILCEGERRYYFMWWRKKIPFYAREKEDSILWKGKRGHLFVRECEDTILWEGERSRDVTCSIHYLNRLPIWVKTACIWISGFCWPQTDIALYQNSLYIEHVFDCNYLSIAVTFWKRAKTSQQWPDVHVHLPSLV